MIEVCGLLQVYSSGLLRVSEKATIALLATSTIDISMM